MAYRRRQGGVPKDLTFITNKDGSHEIGSSNPNSSPYIPMELPPDDTSSASSLAAKAIRASSAHRDSSLSSAYVQSAHSPRDSKGNPLRSPRPSSIKDSPKYAYTSMQSLDEEPKRGFWGVLARKAKSIIEDDNGAEHHETPERRRLQMSDKEIRGENSNQHQSPEIHPKAENTGLQKGLDAIASSLNYIGGTIGNALEEGITIVENRTADIIQETRKLQIRKKGSTPEAQSSAFNVGGTRKQTQNSAFSAVSTRQQPQMQIHSQPQTQTDVEIQLKASRDVAMAMAAKAKLLLRELKTVKADLAFAKERCAQLEEENRILRESSGDGDRQEDDDLIRLQLETLLAEKARLAQENSVFARENRFLREIVEYHQLTMQDVVYLDEGSEEVTEVYPIRVSSTNNLESINITPTFPPSLTQSPSTPRNLNPQFIHEVAYPSMQSTEPVQDSHTVIPRSSS